MNALPDLDSREQVERFVDLFYQRLLEDEVMAPIFLDVAGVELQQHLPPQRTRRQCRT